VIYLSNLDIKPPRVSIWCLMHIYSKSLKVKDSPDCFDTAYVEELSEPPPSVSGVVNGGVKHGHSPSHDRRTDGWLVPGHMEEACVSER